MFYAPPTYFSSFLPTVLNCGEMGRLHRRNTVALVRTLYLARRSWRMFLMFPIGVCVCVQKNPAFRKLISLARLGSHIQMTSAHFWEPPIPLSSSHSRNLSSTTVRIFWPPPIPAVRTSYASFTLGRPCSRERLGRKKRIDITRIVKEVSERVSERVG